MEHSLIIDQLSERLGGQVRLAEKLGLSNTTISHWRNDDGIPPRHFATLLKIADRAGYRLTLGQLDAGPARPVRRDSKPCEVA